MDLFNNVFYEIATILVIATIMGGVALRLRQPLIMAFIAVGVLVGPAGLGLVVSNQQVELLASLGIALLLFVVGLKLDPQEIQEVGLVAITTGLGQIFLTGLIGYILASLFGFNVIESFYIGIALTFSSTIIIVKLLSDKKEIDALHGRIAVGVLIIQDIVVILVMIALSIFNGETDNIFLDLWLLFFKGSGFLIIIGLLTKYVLGFLLHQLAYSTELLLIFAIAWAISLASLGDVLGFSQEVGAFIAGVSIASTSYRTIIGARLVSLRDFLLLFFFINLGIHIDIANLGSEIIPAVVLSIFVLVGKPLMVIILMLLMGYRKYTCILASTSLCQISEFSLILVAFGVSNGQISEDSIGLITLVALITMGISTYVIIYSHSLYKWLSPKIAWLERYIHSSHKTLEDLAVDDIPPVDIIVLGLGRYGGSLIEYLSDEEVKVLGIDFNPEVVKFWRKKGVLAFYGDAEDPELIASLPKREVQWIISTLPQKYIGLTLLHTLKDEHFSGKIALTSHSELETISLNQAGADLVLLPFQDAAKQASVSLVETLKN